MANFYDKGRANNQKPPTISNLGSGNYLRIGDVTEGSVQTLHDTLIARMSPSARKIFQPHQATDANGNPVLRMFNPGFTREGERRETVDFMATTQGAIFGRNTSNQNSMFNVTGMANVETGKAISPVDTLHNLLNASISGRQQSVPALMGKYGFPSFDTASMTPQRMNVAASTYAGISGYQKDSYGHDIPIMAHPSRIAGFSAPGVTPAYTGEGSHFVNANTYFPAQYRQNEQGQFDFIKAKFNKNIKVPNVVAQSQIGIPNQQRALAFGMPGQTSPDYAQPTQMAFAMFGGGGMPEGTQFMREGTGHLPTFKTFNMNLTPQQAAQYQGIQGLPETERNAAMSQQFGFAPGQAFMHRNVAQPTMAPGFNMQPGMFSSIPGLQGHKPGSSLFSLVQDVRFNTESNQLSVGVAGYTDLTTGTSKFMKKAQIQGVGRNAVNTPMDIRWANSGANIPQPQAVQAMPSPEKAAEIGLASLRTTYSEEQIKPMFMDYAQSSFRIGSTGGLIKQGQEGFGSAFPINEEVGNYLYGQAANLTGRGGTIMSNLGAAHFAANLNVGFTTAQITQEQFTGLQHTFEHGGQSYQRFSEPQDLGNGFLQVQQADIYANLTMPERYQKTYQTGQKTFKGAALDNMAYAHPENYDVLRQIQEIQGGNSALRFRQVMSANTNPQARTQLEQRRKISNITDLNASTVLGNIPLDAEDRQTQFIRALAKGEHGRDVIEMNGKLMPSPREALSRITRDKTGREVRNFGTSYFQAIQAHSAMQEANATGIGQESAQANYQAMASRAYDEAQKLSNTSSVIQESNAIRIKNSMGGPAGAMPGLLENEVLMDKTDMYNMMGVNQLPGRKQGRARGLIDQMRGKMPDYFTMAFMMHPNVNPAFQIANLSTVTKEEYMQRPGAIDPGDIRGKSFISQTLAKTFGKDFDGDLFDMVSNAFFGNSRKGIQAIRNNTRPTTPSAIRAIAAQQFAEDKTIKESMEYGGSADYKRMMQEASSPGGTNFKSMEQVLESYKGVQSSKASIGPAYNTGLKLVEGARLANDPEAAGAMGWIMQAAYQTATKEETFNDEGFNRIRNIMQTGNYDWSKDPTKTRAGYVYEGAAGKEYRNFQETVGAGEEYTRATKEGGLPSRNYAGGHLAFAQHIAESFAMIGGQIGSEEYASKIAPNLATGMLPRGMRGNVEAHAAMTQALIQSHTSGDYSQATSTFSNLVGGPVGVLKSVFGRDASVRSSAMAPVGGMTIAKALAKGGEGSARMGRTAGQVEEMAGMGSGAKAAIDIKRMGSGGAAHQLAVAGSNPLINRHSAYVQSELGGVPPEESIQPISSVQQKITEFREAIGLPIGKQTRNEYLAGRGGVYQRSNKRRSGSMGFFGTSQNIDELNSNQLFGYDAQNVMERTIEGMQSLHPELREVAFEMGEGKSFDPNYNHDALRVRLPRPDAFQAHVADKMGDDAFMDRMSAFTNVEKDQLTPEIIMAGMIAHESGHAVHMIDEELHGDIVSLRQKDRMERHRAMEGHMQYKDILTERVADKIAGESLNKLGAAGVNLGLWRDEEARSRNSGNIIKDAGYSNELPQAAMGMTGRGHRPGRRVVSTKSAYQPSSGDPQYYHEDGSLTEVGARMEASGGGKPPNRPPPGVTSEGNSDFGRSNSSFVTNIAEQTTNITNRNMAPTNRTDVTNLEDFFTSGNIGELQGMMQLVSRRGAEELEPHQQKRFKQLVAGHRAAMKAVDAYSVETGMVKGGHKLSGGALGVEAILGRGDNYEQLKSIDEQQLIEQSNAVKSAFQAGLPEANQVSGQALAKGRAGIDSLAGAASDIKAFSEQIKTATVVTQKQHESMTKLTKQYDAAEQVVNKLTSLRQHGGELTDAQKETLQAGKDVMKQSGTALGVIRGKFAQGTMGGIEIQAPAMAQEERQQRLMEALNRGGVGGARARSQAKAKGLYGSMGEEGDEGGLDIWGTHIQGEGAIDLAGGMMRLGNRASAVLHGMTHLTHNIINPIAAEIQQYGDTQISRGQMIAGTVSGTSYQDMMSGQGGKALIRRGNQRLMQEQASQQVYNTYAGIADTFGTKNFGMMQGMAQSIAAPALSAAVGMQVIGAGSFAAPVALGVAAFTAYKWLSESSADVKQVRQSSDEFNRVKQGGIKNIGDAFSWYTNGLIRAAAEAANPDVAIAADKQSSAKQMLGTTFYNPKTFKVLTASERQAMVAQAAGITKSQSAALDYEDYLSTDSAKGLSTGQQDSIFGFVQRYSSTGMPSDQMRGELSEFAQMNIDAPGITTGIASSRGNKLISPDQMTDSYKKMKAAWAAAQKRGESGEVFNDRQSLQSMNAQARNQYRYQAQGPGYAGVDETAYDPRAGDSYYQANVLGVEQSNLAARQTNNYRTNQGMYGVISNADKMRLADNSVELTTYQQNEQNMLQIDRRQRALGGKGLNNRQIIRGNRMTQTQQDVFQGLQTGDQWITSAAAGRGQVDLALQSIDTKTGLSNIDYGVSSARFEALKKYDRLGLSANLNASDVAKGVMGLQRESTLAQRANTQFQFTQATQQRQVQMGMMSGGGTLNAQGYVQGGNMNQVAQVFAANGMKFQNPGMTQWQIEDAQTGLSRQQQQFGMKQQTQQMAMQWQQFAISGQQWQENRALNVEQFNYNTQFQRGQMQIDRSHQVTQQGWQRQDWQYGRNMSELQFGFQMRDADRNIRYARGRDRLDLMRQRDDATIMHAAEMGQSDKEKNRMTEQQKWSEDQFKRDKDHFDKVTDFQKRQMDLEKKHFEENRKFELQSLQMSQEAHTKAMGWMTAEWALEDKGRSLNRQGQLLQNHMAEVAQAKQEELFKLINHNQDAVEFLQTTQSNALAKQIADANTYAGVIANIGIAYQNIENSISQGSSYSGQSGTGSGNVYGGGLANGGYFATRSEMRGFAAGGFTGVGDKNAVRGSVHGGEYVIPQQGTPVIRGDNQESLTVLKLIASILERIEKNPAVVNAVINTNQSNVAMRNLSLTDLAHGTLQ